MLWTLNDRRKADDPDGEPAEPPTGEQVMRNFAKIPLAALGRAH